MRLLRKEVVPGFNGYKSHQAAFEMQESALPEKGADYLNRTRYIEPMSLEPTSRSTCFFAGWAAFYIDKRDFAEKEAADKKYGG